MSPKAEPHPRDRELIKIGRYWYYRGTPVPGRGEIKKSLKVESPALAIQAKKHFLLNMRGVDPTKRDLLFSDVSALILKEKSKRRINTVKEATYYIGKLGAFFDYYPVSKISDDLWDEYVRQEIALKPRLLHYDRKQMISVLKRALKLGQLREMPELHVPDPERTAREIFKPEEIRALYDAASSTLKGLILGMYKMGFRPAEFLRLTWDRVDFSKNTITLRREDVKANPRTVQINQSVRQYLMDRHASLGKRDYGTAFVFPSKDSKGTQPLHRYNKQWTRLLEKVNVPYRPPYSLRHTFLTEAAKRVRNGEVSIVMICDYAGTSIEEFEKTYLHIDGEDTKGVASIMDIGGAI